MNAVVRMYLPARIVLGGWLRRGWMKKTEVKRYDVHERIITLQFDDGQKTFVVKGCGISDKEAMEMVASRISSIRKVEKIYDLRSGHLCPVKRVSVDYREMLMVFAETPVAARHLLLPIIRGFHRAMKQWEDRLYDE